MKRINKEKSNGPEFVKFETQLQTHLELQRAHRHYEESLRGMAKINSTIQVVNSDHMSKKFMIKLHNYTKKKFKISSCFKIYPGGHFIAKTGQTRYFLTTDYYGETANTICSQLHQIIHELNPKNLKKLYLVMDNHSTNKNFTILAYIDFLVFFYFYFNFQ